MKRLLIFIFVALCHQLWASTPQVDGLYVWNPGKRLSIIPDKRRNSEPSPVVWDSLIVSPDSSYTLKRSRYYDVGGKIKKDAIYGRWYNKREFVSLVPHNVNYSCIPSENGDSVISVYLSEINKETRDTIPIKSGIIHVCSENGVAKYYMDSTGHIDIKCSSIVWAIYIRSFDNATTPWPEEAIIPLPDTGCRYNVTLPCYGERNVMANLYKIRGDNLCECFLYKDSLFVDGWYAIKGDNLCKCFSHKDSLRLGSQHKRVVEKAKKSKTIKRHKEHKRLD